MLYYSEKLNKNFKTIKDLEAAEEKHEAEQAKKAEAKALVAKESAEVNDAFKARNAARKAYNESLIKARKIYNEALRKAKDEFEASLKESIETLDKAETDYDNKLSAFQKAHQYYHLTLKDGDNVVTLVSDPVDYQVRSIDKEFDDILDMFSNFIRHW